MTPASGQAAAARSRRSRTAPRGWVRPADLLGATTSGLRARPLRAALSGLGIAIGIGAAVAVLGISASGRAALLARLGAEGNLLTVSAGQSFDGSPAPLPASALPMIRRIPPVGSATAVGYLNGATVRRTAAVPVIDTGGISVLAVQPSLLSTLHGTVARGNFLNRATSGVPAVVLGAGAARALGVVRVSEGSEVYLDGHYFSVAGILRPVAIAPEIDQAALIGFPIAGRWLGFNGQQTEIYLRSAPDQVAAVDAVLPFTADPAQPEGVQVSRPSELLAARAQASTALAGLFVALGAVAVLIGGVGIANIMVISVLERRPEVGLRRALGATRRHIATQFLGESVVLSLLGGVAGVILGAAAASGYALAMSEPPVLPLAAAAGGIGAATVTGALAGALPAARASRLAPADVLRGS
jgi:putative ABC transport system permease protein